MSASMSGMHDQRPLVPGSRISPISDSRASAGREPSSAASASSQGEASGGPTFPSPSLHQRKKKPGPKRDSKPAPSEKLERNRQAQRTHRERKEQYTKDLEVEVLRLKELYVTATRERDGAFDARDHLLTERDQLFVENQKLLEENQRLRETIQTSSASTDSGYGGTSVSCDVSRNNSVAADDHPETGNADGLAKEYGTHESVTTRPQHLWELCESRGFASDGPIQEIMPIIKTESSDVAMAGHDPNSMVLDTPSVQVDYDELALDFVLSLERPCMGHIQYLHVRAHNYQASQEAEMAGMPLEVPDDGENQHISGHALMATAPPYSHLMSNPATRYPTQFPGGLKRDDLLRLLDLSSQLEITDPELPPVKAWMRMMQDRRVQHMNREELALLKETLLSKVHCYRFGAVVEEHDLESTIEEVVQARLAIDGNSASRALPASMAPDLEAPPPGTAL